MKLKTEQEIERLSVAHANMVSDASFPEWHGREASFRRGYTQAQQELVASAREGFEEWWDKERGGRPLEDSHIPVTERQLYKWEKEAWQAAKLSSAKEIEKLKKDHKNEEDCWLIAVESRDVQITDLQKENEELISLIVKIRHTIEKNHPEYFDDWIGEFVHSPVVCLERVYLLLKEGRNEDYN